MRNSSLASPLIGLSQSLGAFPPEQGVGVAEDLGQFGGERAGGDEGGDRGWVKGFGAGAGKPMAGFAAEEVVAGFGVAQHVVGESEVAEPEDDGDVEVLGGLLDGGQSGAPVVPPVGAEGVDSGLFPAFDDGRQEGVGAIEQIKGFEVFVEVAGFGGSEAEGVNLGMAETEEIVENDGTQGGAEVDQFLRWGVEVAAFVGGTDDEDAHVALGGGGDDGPVELVDVVPVNVDVVELIGGDRPDDDVGGTMGGEADEADFALGLQLVNGVEEAVGGGASLDVVVEVDAVDRE